MKELKNTVVNTKTKAEYDELMRLLEDDGWKWSNGALPTWSNSWLADEKDTCIEVTKKSLLYYDSKSYYQDEGYKVITLDEFKEVQGIGKRKVGRPRKERSIKYVVTYDENDVDPVKHFTDRKEMIAWLKEAKEDESIDWDSIRIFDVVGERKPTASVNIRLSKVR